MRFLMWVALVVVAVLLAGVYGALHDQISYTVSEEYFTKFKYRQFGIEELELPDRGKAALIGFLASWWMGVPIGVLVGGFGFLHRPAAVMFRKTLKAYGAVVAVTLVVGLLGLGRGWLAAADEPRDPGGRFIPKEGLVEERRFYAVGDMHNASYLGGVLGLLAGVVAQFIQRKR